MKLGIMGTGKIVQEALPVIMEVGLEKCYLMGREHSAERTEKLCKQYHLDGCFLSPKDMLAADIDTVYIALPNNLHFSFAEQAIAAGKHVILEKPSVPTGDELVRLADETASARVFLLEAMSLHYLPAFISLRENIADLGQIRMVDFRFCQYSSRYDAFLRGDVAPAFDPACMGGALMDLNVYNIHAMLSLFGVPRSAEYHPNMQRGVDTSGVAVLDYGDFKAVAMAAKDCQAPVHSVICGERGAIHINMPANQIAAYEIVDNQGHIERHDFFQGRHRLYYEFMEFERIIREADSRKADEMLDISISAAELLERMRSY